MSTRRIWRHFPKNISESHSQYVFECELPMPPGRFARCVNLGERVAIYFAAFGLVGVDSCNLSGGCAWVYFHMTPTQGQKTIPTI